MHLLRLSKILDRKNDPTNKHGERKSEEKAAPLFSSGIFSKNTDDQQTNPQHHENYRSH